ncbi:MAG: hypothetical protein ABL921_03870 [Pirellula sp.]
MQLIVNSTKVQKRTKIAKLLAMSFCVAGGFASQASLAVAQHCDQCDSLSTSSREPACGCEPQLRPKQQCAAVPCEPKLSFAQKFLKKLDELGDTIEGKISRPHCAVDYSSASKANCDTRQVRESSCGCELCASDSVCDSSLVSATQPRGAYAFPDNPSKHAIGTISDQFLPPITKPTPGARMESRIGQPALPPVARAPQSNQSNQVIQKPRPSTQPVHAPAAPAEPSVSTDSSSRPSQRPVIANELEGTLEQTLPPMRSGDTDLAPRSLPHAMPPLNSNQPLPDVLVDPFKDDPSAMDRRLNRSDVQLTSGRRSQKSGFKLRAPVSNGDASPSESEIPAPLTPAQRDVRSLEFESSEPVERSPVDTSRVVPSAFVRPVTVTSTVRKPRPSSEEEQIPIVSRMNVPVRR